MPKIYILLPVHNRIGVTRDFIECLRRQTFANYYLVLIDDGSSDGTAEMVQQQMPGATVLKGTGNWWWAGSLQQGLNWLKQHEPAVDDLILFINDDVTFDHYYLQRAVGVMTGKQGVMVLSRARSEDGAVLETGITANLKRLSFDIADSPQAINCLSTRGLFIHWADLKTIGDFHTVLLPHYLSDYEYTIRGYRKGIKCETSDEILIGSNDLATGFRQHNTTGLIKYLKNKFSKRSPFNPLYLSSMALLTAHPLWIPIILTRIWGNVGFEMINILIGKELSMKGKAR